MKIGIACRDHVLDKGGKERYSVMLGRQLVRAGHEVHVLANTHLREPGITFHRVPIWHLGSPFKHLSFAHFAGRAAAGLDLSVLHSMDRLFRQDIFRVSDGISPVMVAQRYESPLLRAFKSAGLRRRVLSALERRIFLSGGCKCIMTNSELVKEQILDHYPVAPGRIRVLYNGVDTGRFHARLRDRARNGMRDRLGHGETDRVILFVANNFRLKNLRFLLEAMALSAAPETRLLVVGNDDPGPYLKWARTHGLGDRVRFAGPRSDTPELYAAADLFVLPTRYDAFANVCLEAMACGLPVITTRHNGAAELIEEGRNGYVLQGDDPRELARRITEMSTLPPDESAEMSRRCAAVAGAFTLEAHAKRAIRLYEEVRQWPRQG